jgi:deoxyribonuclease-4
MGEEKARLCGSTGRKYGVKLSVHAPYYINCCAKEKPKLDASVRYIVTSAQIAFWLNASPVVIHPGHYMERPPEECRKLVIATLERCLEEMSAHKITGVKLGMELTGKKSAYGSLSEIIDLSAQFGFDKVMPVIDYAHYHAREGRLKGKEDYLKILEQMENGLGAETARDFHCHFSGIEFTDKGERNHLPISADSPPFEPLAQAWKENGWSGKAICESPLLEKDALKMQSVWERIASKE